jgi:hypothetical protein
MHTDWKTPYQFAIREQNPAKLEDLYEQARHAIHNRVLELEENVADCPRKRRTGRGPPPAHHPQIQQNPSALAIQHYQSRSPRGLTETCRRHWRNIPLTSLRQQFGSGAV